MAQLKTINTNELANLSRFLVGVDRIINSHYVPSTNYPPHNVVKYDDNNYGIEIAIAGFSKDQISLEVNQNIISVRGERIENEEHFEYLFKGLAARNFVIQFPLSEFMVIREAEVKDGMLKISLEYVVPDSLKPRQIKIK
jgi:molecular chaperone IbpA